MRSSSGRESRAPLEPTCLEESHVQCFAYALRFEEGPAVSTVVFDCYRCKAVNMTFDVRAFTIISKIANSPYEVEICLKCRKCLGMSILHSVFVNDDLFRKNGSSFNIATYQGDLTPHLGLQEFITLADVSSRAVPDDLPPLIDASFKEGVRCLAIGCGNAAATMFRLSLDLATKAQLPDDASSNPPNTRVRNNLAARLEWLFDNRYISDDLKSMSDVIRDHGNDGAHEGCLDGAEAENIYDFTFEYLERVYTVPARLAAMKERRAERRSNMQN